METDKKYIKKLFGFSSYDLKAIEQYLEEMAAKGFMFVKQGSIFFYFEKCEPKQLKFCVDVFDKASVYDTRPEAETQEYIEYCKASGWQYLFTSGKLQYFYTEDKEATPIQTDNEIKLKLIHKHFMSSNGINWIIIGLMMLFQLVSFIYSHTPIESFIQGWQIPFSYGIYFFILIPQIIRYLYFYIKNKKCLVKREELFFFEQKKARNFHNVVWGLGMLMYIILMASTTTSAFGIWMFLFMILIIGVFYIVIDHMRGKNNSRRVNKAVMICLAIATVYVTILAMVTGVLMDGELSNKHVSYYDEEGDYINYQLEQDEVPLNFENLQIETGAEFEETRAEKYSSLFGSYEIYDVTKYDENMRQVACMKYEVIESPFEFIMDAYQQEMIQESNYILEEGIESEAALWGANCIYTIVDGDWQRKIAFYENKALMITSNQVKYTAENINIILEFLETT